MHLNFFKIDLPFDEFNVQELPYSEEAFKRLKDQYNSRASFFRHGDSIYISPAIGFDENLGNLVRVKVHERPEIVRSLIRHLLFRSFRDDPNTEGMLPESFSPLSFFSRKNQHDPVRQYLPKEVQGFVQYPRVNEVYVKSVNPGLQHTFGIVIKGRHRWRLNRDLKAMLDDGLDLKGLTVFETTPLHGLDGVLADDEQVLGQIESHDGKTAQVLTNTGVVQRDLASLHLQRTSAQIRRYLNAKVGKSKARSIFEAVKAFHGSTSRSKEIAESLKLVKWFSKKEYRNNDGFCFSITTNAVQQPSGIRIERTRLVFDISPGAAKSTVLSGLKAHGPFDSSRYPNKKLKILGIFHQRQHGAATSFMGKLINGIPDSSYYKQGLQALFRLHEVNFEIKSIGASFPEDYEGAIDQAIKENQGGNFHIALVECPDGSDTVPISENPYYRAKARLMSYGIPVQCVKEEHLRRNTQGLGYTLGPFALQVYSKTGGVPWILPSSQSTDAELVIGIGHSVYRKNQWAHAEQSRVVGFTTFFNGDGRYLMGQESRTVPYDDYFDELLKSLKRSLRTIAEEYGWQEGQTVRLVFHVFKPIKNTEIEVVERLVSELDFKVIFAFVTISRRHPWMMLSSLDVRGENVSAEPALRGETFLIDHNACLVQLCGRADRPNRTQPVPPPVIVRIHENSTYKDLPYITQQVVDFSYLNWRSFFPSELPAPIFYSSIMAGLSQRLEMIDSWNATMLDQHFRRKTWFL